MNFDAGCCLEDHNTFILLCQFEDCSHDHAILLLELIFELSLKTLKPSISLRNEVIFLKILIVALFRYQKRSCDQVLTAFYHFSCTIYLAPRKSNRDTHISASTHRTQIYTLLLDFDFSFIDFYFYFQYFMSTFGPRIVCFFQKKLLFTLIWETYNVRKCTLIRNTYNFDFIFYRFFTIIIFS